MPVAKRTFGIAMLAVVAAGCSGGPSAGQGRSTTTTSVQSLSDGTYCGTVTGVDVSAGTFRYRAETEGAPGPVIELSGLQADVTPGAGAFTVNSDIGGPPTTSATQSLVQGYLQLLLDAVHAQPTMTYDVKVSGGIAVSVAVDKSGSQSGATYFHGCFVHR